MRDSLADAEMLFEKGNIEDGLKIIDQLVETNPENGEALMIKATIFYKQQKWGDALNALNKILEFDPENEKAKNYKQMVMNILTYWNKDSFNP